MLFRTVYGQELEVIYQVVQASAEGLHRQQILSAFIPTSQQQDKEISPQNVEDALSFLISGYLLDEQEGVVKAVEIDLPFKLALLRNLRQIELGILTPRHPLDSLFMALLNNLFVLPDVLFADNLHPRANSIDGIRQQGGVSKEKIQAWKRVMEYLGLGYRVQSGFMSAVSPSLIERILTTMTDNSSTLQYFFEQILAPFLPYLSRSGDVCQAIRQPMLYLEQTRIIKLTPLQDSPSKAYFLPNNLRQIAREVVYATV